MSLSDGQKLHTPTPAEIFDQARTKALELYPNDAPGYLEKFKDCSKAEDVIVILENQVKKFKSFREDRWKPVRKKLTPVVSILLQVVSVVKGTVSSVNKLCHHIHVVNKPCSVVANTWRG